MRLICPFSLFYRDIPGQFYGLIVLFRINCIYLECTLRIKEWYNMAQKELVFKRKITRSANGQARLSLPREIVESLGAKVVGLVWKGGSVTICPWPVEDV